ncbi:DUF924 family protein [Aestuariibius sp. HNIBRBA575]|uniref:DUF924 family protein n=1 Tax=Aestuariibius sp. HNIBRBA575 TaxID=3233343 RepID=UPI0034A25027
MVNPEEILEFWLNEVGPSRWYGGGEELDTEIRNRFEDVLNEAKGGACGLWLTYPIGTLAFIILTDQLPRNMYRDNGQAFDTDRSARAASKIAITRDWDLKIPEPARQFFYMPLLHSENLIDQDRAVRLFCTRMPDTGEANLLHAKVHREIIRRFGRFPYRNAALGRDNTQPEQEFLENGSYGSVLEEIKSKEAASAA